MTYRRFPAPVAIEIEGHRYLIPYPDSVEMTFDKNVDYAANFLITLKVKAQSGIMTNLLEGNNESS